MLRLSAAHYIAEWESWSEREHISLARSGCSLLPLPAANTSVASGAWAERVSFDSAALHACVRVRLCMCAGIMGISVCVCVYVLFVCAHACKRERITRSHHAILFQHNVVNVFLPPNVALIFSVRIETLWRTVENLSVSINRSSSSRKAPKQQQQHQLEKKIKII